MIALQFPDSQRQRLVQRLTDHAMHAVGHKPVPGNRLPELTRLEGLRVQLNHPYVDRTHPDIRMGVDALINLYSQHLMLPADDLPALLHEAADRAIRLILDPVSTLQELIFADQIVLPLATYERWALYALDFDFLAQGVGAYARKHDQTHVKRDQLTELAPRLAGRFEAVRKQRIDDYQSERFLALVGQELERFSTGDSAFASVGREDKPSAPAPPQAERPENTEESIRGIKDRIQQVLKRSDEDAPLSSAPGAQTPGATRFEPVLKPRETSASQETASPHPEKSSSEPAQPSQPANPSAHPSAKRPAQPEEEPRNLADRYANQQRPTSLNEQLKTSGTEVLSQKMIPLHKQFQYIQKVFGGNRNRFQDTLAALNEAGSYKAAETYMAERILNRPEVDRNDPVTKEFMQFLRAQLS